MPKILVHCSFFLSSGSQSSENLEVSHRHACLDPKQYLISKVFGSNICRCFLKKKKAIPFINFQMGSNLLLGLSFCSKQACLLNLQVSSAIRTCRSFVHRRMRKNSSFSRKRTHVTGSSVPNMHVC